MDKLSSVYISNSKTKSKSLVFSFLFLSAGMILILGQFSPVNCTSPYYEVDKQALLDALRSFGFHNDLSLNGYPGERDPSSDYKELYPKFHQLERKGGRAPTLRLRFGKRSYPNWPPLTNSQEMVN